MQSATAFSNEYLALPSCMVLSLQTSHFFSRCQQDDSEKNQARGETDPNACPAPARQSPGADRHSPSRAHHGKQRRLGSRRGTGVVGF